MSANIEVVTPDRQMAAAVASMTFPAYRHMLALERTVRLPREFDDTPVDPFAVVALEGGEPVGLALAEQPAQSPDVAELLSVFVRSDRRGHGIGGRLVEAIEMAAKNRGAQRLVGVYTTGKPGIEAFEKIATRREWSGPETRMVSVRFSAESLAAAPWIGRYRLGPSYEIFPWAELRNDERDQIRKTHEQEKWIAEDLVPWLHDSHGFEPRTSLGLRRDGVVVGWIINHLMDEKTVRYTCSFIRKPLGKMGKIVPLYSASFERFIAAGFQQATFTTPLQHRGMVGFARKWFGPWSTFLGETRGVERIL